MKKKRQQVNKVEAKGSSAGVLKKKTLICSSEAAAISIGIHLLIVLMAGSWVAVRYVQKQKAELTAYNPPPKMERRQLSAPAKMERIQQTSQRPKIVSSRMAASDTEFSLPAMAGVEKVSTQKFSSPFAKSNRDFSVLTKGVTFRLANFRFLGIRTQGEKLVFVIDASREMLSKSTGGEAACTYIKQELSAVLSEMPSSVLFNVILYDEETVAAFNPKMIPVSDDSLLALQEWIAPALSQRSPKGLAPEQNTYEPSTLYETAVGNEAKGWVRAMQAALELCPDSVFVVGRDWGRNPLSREKGQRLMDFSLWQILGGRGKDSVYGSKALIEDREMRDGLVRSAVEAIADEEKFFRSKNYPVPFLHDLVHYMQYSADQIVEHLGVVYWENYRSLKIARPEIHYIRLVSEAQVGVSDSSTRNIREFIRDYNGEFKFLNGRSLQKKMRDVEAGDVVSAEVERSAPESEFKFFGTSVKSSRVAFVLDVSEKMFTEEAGGENSFESIKMQLAQMVKALNPGTPFNILAAGEERVVAFSSQMTSGVAPEAVESWLAAIQRGLKRTDLPEEQRIDVPASVYKTAIGTDIKGLPLALQVAMEQRADTILVAGIGVAPLPVDREKSRRLLNFSIINALGDEKESSSGKGKGGKSSPESEVGNLSEGESSIILDPLVEDREQWQQIMQRAFLRMEEENQTREDADLPLGFIRDVFDYIQYTPENIIDHLLAVSREVYSAGNKMVDLPVIHFGQLTVDGQALSRDQRLAYEEFAKRYKSKIQVIPGAASNGKRKSKPTSSFSTSRREVSNGAPLGLPTVKFLGVRAKGEKLIFMVDASRAMLSESSGGEEACTHIKQELQSVLSELPSSALFNVILYDDAVVAAFRPEMIPVSREGLSELEEWLAPALSRLSPDGLAPEQNTYRPQTSYETAIGEDSKDWLRAMQAALEQRPDTLFMVGRDWDRNTISREKGQRLIDFSLWQVLGGDGANSFAESEVLIEDREMRDRLLVGAVNSIVEEEKLREEEKGPTQFVRDFSSYMQYSTEQILDHVDVVCRANYDSVQQASPSIHCIRLVSEDEAGDFDSSTEKIRELVRVYDGEFEFLNGTAISGKILDEDGNENEDAADTVDTVDTVDTANAQRVDAPDIPEAKFTFFGMAVESSRIAFVLEVSKKMFTDEIGGENSFNFIKGQISQTIKSFDPETQFNILAYDEERVVAFAPKMKSGCDPDEVDNWLAAIQLGLELTDLPASQKIDVSASVYKTAIGEDIRGMPLALQVAMEQRADKILVAGAGMGRLPVGREKARRLLNFSILNALGSSGDDFSSEQDRDTADDLGGGGSSGMLSPLGEDQKQWTQLMAQAFKLMAEENVEREDSGLPLGFVRDVFDYIQYTPAHVFNHLQTVSREFYPIEANKVKPPQINFVQVIGADQKVGRMQLKEYQGFIKAYESQVQFFRGSYSDEGIRKLNRALDLYE